MSRYINISDFIINSFFVPVTSFLNKKDFSFIESNFEMHKLFIINI
jgi:hypothetical protein